jgi:nicotinamidase-related amidase
MRPEALLVVDMQADFMEDKHLDDLACKLATIQSIILSFRDEGLPVFFTVSILNNRISPILSALPLPSLNETIVKDENDAFRDTDFQFRLERLQIQTLHVVGCNANFCVLETVLSAVNYGYHVVMYKNAIMATDSDEKILRVVHDEVLLPERVQGKITVTEWERQ